MAINQKIFKAYDLRGIYPEEINEEAAYSVGRAFVSFLGAKTVAVGKDMRQSGLSLFKELVRGITDQGADVVDIGMCTTPMLSFAVASQKYDGGIMISASHNPGNYNAFKLIRFPAEQLSAQTGIDEIKKLTTKPFKSVKKGIIKKKDILAEYIKHILPFAADIKGLKIVIDYGNGVGAISSKPFFSKLGIDVIHMYDNPDGSFPNHPANPHDLENLDDLRKRVKQERADLGIFYDGDADRSLIVDSSGEILSADILVGILAVYELEKHPGEKVYYDLRFTRAVSEIITSKKGIPIKMKVGNPFYKAALIHDGGIIAGEFSGHIMFKDNYCIDDGLFAAVKLMSLMCKTKKKIPELARPFQKYFQSEEINLRVADAKLTLDKAATHYAEGKFSDLDGILVEFPEWWFSLRMSNTEPLVRLRLEANNKVLLAEKRKELLGIIK